MKTLTEKDYENYAKAEDKAFKLDFQLNDFPIEAYSEVHQLDHKLVGTIKYLGLCYFHAWTSDYKWFFREIRINEKRRIHKETLDRGFAKNKKTMMKFWEKQGPKQNAIIRKVMGKKRLETFCQIHNANIEREFGIA